MEQTDTDTVLDPEALGSGDDARPRGGRATEIRTSLQEEIETGKLPPGTALDERALAGRFQVSRTPVREALQQLAARNLVKITPRQGITVSRLSVSRVRAIMDCIGELEATCAKLAARRVDDDLRAKLEEALQHCQDAAVEGGTEEYGAANANFHEVVYAGSRNPYLADLIRTARRQIHRYRLRDFVSKPQINQSLQDHRKVARAIEAGDEAAAAEQMLLHVPSGSTGFSEFLARIPMHLFEAEPGDA
jgi:DNA-binding GntR family transcriptional regulator